MDVLLYVNSIANKFDSSVRESLDAILNEAFGLLSEAKYNVFFAKQENYDLIMHAVKQHSSLMAIYDNTGNDYWLYTGMLKKNISSIPRIVHNTYF